MRLAVLINYKAVGKKAIGKKHFAQGKVEHETFNNVDDLADIIASVAENPKECLAVGTFKGNGKVTFKDDEHFSRKAKDMLPGNILVIDNDTEQPYDVEVFGEYWETFKKAGYVQTRSGSTLAGSKKHGTHTYFMYEDGDVKKAMKLLEAICIIEGYYKLEFHKTGRAVIKTPVDIKLNEVQMPIYEDDIDPKVVKGSPVDITTYPDNYDLLIKKAQKISDNEIQSVLDESRKLHKKWLEEHRGIKNLSSDEIDVSLRDLDSHEIDETMKLFKDGKLLGTVGDLLLGDIVETTFSDIYEPGYGNGSQKSKFYGNIFFSQAHGGIKYYVKVSYAWYHKNKKDLVYDVNVKEKELTDMIHSELTDEEIVEILDKVDNAVERKKIYKEIKKYTGLSEADIKAAYNRFIGVGEYSLSEYFHGASIFWDGNLGVYVEYNDTLLRLHTKTNFPQTLMSKLNKPSSEIKDILPMIPLKYIEYVPTIDGNSDHEHINIFKPVKFPKKEVTKIPPTINKLLRNLFVDDYKAKAVFVNWMATILQTGIRTGVAWGFFGEQGTGKGIICDIFRDLVGRRNSSMNVGDSQLQNDYNGYAKHVQFIHLNEVASDFHGRHGVAGKLKALVTDNILQINEKYITSHEVENYANIILNSNKPNPIELDVGDRRWNMINTTKPLTKCSWFKGQETYLKIMNEVIDFGCYLMDYEIDEYAATKVMELSKSKRSISEQTTSPFRLLADAIKEKDYNRICDMVDAEDKFSGIDVEDIQKCIDEGFYPSNMLKSMYSAITGKDNQGTKVHVNNFVKPYLTKEQSIVRNGIRGYEI